MSLVEYLATLLAPGSVENWELVSKSRIQADRALHGENTMYVQITSKSEFIPHHKEQIYK